MDTLEFFKRVLPSQGVYLLAYPTNKGFRHRGFNTLEELAEATAELDKTTTVYHACAAYARVPYRNEDGKWVSRKEVNWRAARSFWVDIDCGSDKANSGKGYATKRDAAKALFKFCEDFQLPYPLVISSGYGIHGYWTLDSEITPAQWIPTANTLKSAMQVAGLLADPTRTADFASVLRPVGTINKKHETPKLVKAVLDSPQILTTDFLAAINNIAHRLSGVPASTPSLFGQLPEFLKGEATGTNSALTSQKSYAEFTYDANKMADQCRVCTQVRDSQGDASYEHWRGVIGLLTFCENGYDTAVEWSVKRGEKHSNTDVDTRFNSWDASPTTCDFFRSNASEYCKDCPHKVTTPLQLGKIIPASVSTNQVVQPSTPVVTQPTLPNQLEVCPAGFSWTGSEMVRYVDTPDGPVAVPFSDIEFYLCARLVDELENFSVLVAKHSRQGKVSKFEMETKLIGMGGVQLMGFLGSKEITATTNKGSEATMSAYLKSSLAALKQSVNTTRSFASFGWQDKDTGFLIGDRFYKKGSVDRVLLRKHAASKSKLYPDPVGSLQGYADALNWVYNRPGMEPMQYAICSLWGAPLAALVDPMYKGIPCALTGSRSGKGKTTAFMASLYAFGDANGMTIKGESGATPKARMALMGTVSSLPILFDEVTNISPIQLSSLAYALSNGGDTERLATPKGASGVVFAESGEWNTHTGMTGNTELISLLSMKGNSEAEAMRIFEINVDEYNIPMLDPKQVAEKLTEMQDNAGCAGDAFIRYVMDNRRFVLDLLHETLKEIGEDSSLATEPKYRFYRYHTICTLTAAKIATKLGFCQFDYDSLVRFANQASTSLCEKIREKHNKTNEDLLEEMLSYYQAAILVTPSMDTGGMITRAVEGGIVGRAIINASVKRSPENPFLNYVFLKCNSVQDWCASNRIAYKEFVNYFSNMGVFGKRQRMVLGRGTNIPTVQTWVYRIDLDRLAVLGVNPSLQNDES